MEQLKTIGRELAMGSQSGWGAAQSKEFLDLVRSIGEARSKAEEDRIVLLEIESLRSRMNSPDVPRRKMKEYLIRLIYVEMLGHDASFGYIHAVKMTHDDSLPIKRTGYLAVTLFLSDAHDLIILIVNTIQKDLRSDNYLIVSAALNAACKLIADEAIPAVLPLVVDLLAHPKETVRKKAVMALHCFHHRSPSSVSHILSNFRKKLCDNDPGVMSASLCPLLDLIKEDPNAYKDLVMSFVSILKQVAERRLPKTYDYHQMPAPFIQIKLLKILALLGSNDKQASEGMYTVLGDIFRKSEQSTNIGNAVLYECICCVSAIHPNPKILKTAAEVTSQFLKNDSHNLKYMGIDALGRLFKINPEIAEEHQLLVIDCLEDPDDTLKRKTFDLLYKMTKSSNVEVIVERMIDYMINITDEHYKTEIASRCVELAEQFAPSNHWFIQTMNKVFEHAGDLVNPRVTHNLMRLIAEGFGEDDDGADSQLRSSAVESYLHILGEPKLPSIFLQVICWVLGEYGTADGKYSASYINGKLCDVAEAHSNDDVVKAYAITAILKISAFEIAAGRGVELLPECQTLIDELLASHSTDLQQRAYELQALLGLGSQAIENIMPFDASCEDIEIDKSLPFLDGFVQQCLLNGARPYSLESERSTVLDNSRSQAQQDVSSHALRFEAYELPKPSLPKTPVPLTPVVDLVPVSESTYAKETTQTLYGQPAAEALPVDSGVKLHLDGVQKKWGRPTYPSSSVPSMPASNTEKTTNGDSNPNIGGTVTVQARDSSYDSASQKVEASEEKQKLAASLFGSSSSKTGRRTVSSSKSTKGATSTPTKAVAQEPPTEKVQAMPPPPDLLDLGDLDDSASVDVPQKDPFEQLEGLVGSNAAAAPTNSDSSAVKESSDLLSLIEDAPVAAAVMSTGGETPAIISSSGLNKESTSGGTSNLMFPKKGPNRVDSLEKDAVARQVGVTPTTDNPNLFSDLLG